MSIEIESRVRRSKRRTERKTKACSTAPLLDAYGKNCPAPGLGYPHYLHFRMADGAEFFHRNAAIEAAGHCPHCLIDFLGDNGFFHGAKDNTRLCAFDFDGPSDGRQRNGKDLITILSRLGLPRVHPLNLFDDGARA